MYSALRTYPCMFQEKHCTLYRVIFEYGPFDKPHLADISDALNFVRSIEFEDALDVREFFYSLGGFDFGVEFVFEEKVKPKIKFDNPPVKYAVIAQLEEQLTSNQ